mmetsp:Transcript_7747/g.26159  ORF Transcript_7747/g.26159 Transcript_7747/m.26159 type:complete len:93 (+) Transcript_7747:670-948(+)
MQPAAGEIESSNPAERKTVKACEEIRAHVKINHPRCKLLAELKVLHVQSAEGYALKGEGLITSSYRPVYDISIVDRLARGSASALVKLLDQI